MITYSIDRRDIILSVGGEWVQFAQENCGEELAAEQVLGMPLFRFIRGDDIIQLYRALFQKVRRTRRLVSFVFRCDAPDYRRRMTMTVAPLPEDGLQVTTDIIAEEERPHIPLLDRDARRSKEIVVACAVCAKVKEDDDCWVDIEDATMRNGWFESDRVPRLSHSFCPVCLAQQLELSGMPD